MPYNSGSRRARYGRGFTLIELLIALALLSIILIALYSTFFVSVKAVEGTGDTIIRLQEGRMALDILRRELASSVFNGSNNLTLFSITVNDISDKNVSVLSFTAFSPNLPGLSNIVYYVENRDGKLVLLKKINPDWNIDINAQGIEIMEDIDNFTVEGLYNGEWVNLWNAREVGRLPDEVRVTITLRFKDKLIPLFEIVRPRIGNRI